VIPRRRFGSTDVELSTLCFGSMRIPPAVDDDSMCDLLCQLIDAGATSMHSSVEYETFPRFCALLEQLRRRRPSVQLQHIVKLAAPHFGHDRFDRDELFTKLDAYRSALATDSIDVVQWMIRFDLQQEQRRLEILHEYAPAISDAVTDLRARGHIGAFACFPYTRTFADAVIPMPWCDGLVDYLNVFELEAAAVLPALYERRKGFIGLRPLAAGRVARELGPLTDKPSSARSAMQLTLMHPAVTSAVVSISRSHHFTGIMRAITAVQ
jgi:aryl-alcohol dehydrogenase-like predicted oxidoreductase